MKKFKLTQSKDDNLLKISSNKTNYEIKLNDDELSELRKELGFNFEFKLPMQEVETEKSIDWRKLTFDDWMSETKKLNLSYDDLSKHINGSETCDFGVYRNAIKGESLNEKTQWVYNQLNPIDWKNLSFPEWFYQTSKLEFDCYEDLFCHYMSDETSVENSDKLIFFIKNISPKNQKNTKSLYEILTNPTILKVGDVVKIGGYEFGVKKQGERETFYLETKPYRDKDQLFKKFGITNDDIHSRFKTTEYKDAIFPETKTLKELTKIYYYLKTFEV